MSLMPATSIFALSLLFAGQAAAQQIDTDSAKILNAVGLDQRAVVAMGATTNVVIDRDPDVTVANGFTDVEPDIKVCIVHLPEKASGLAAVLSADHIDIRPNTPTPAIDATFEKIQMLHELHHCSLSTKPCRRTSGNWMRIWQP